MYDTNADTKFLSHKFMVRKISRNFQKDLFCGNLWVKAIPLYVLQSETQLQFNVQIKHIVKAKQFVV